MTISVDDAPVALRVPDICTRETAREAAKSKASHALDVGSILIARSLFLVTKPVLSANPTSSLFVRVYRFLAKGRH